MKKDLRQEWWKRYGTATGKYYDGMPEWLQRTELDEITTQPLLNYLVALSYVRGEVDFSTQVNLNQIYEDLLKAIYERAYAGGRPLPGIRDLLLKDFIRILEEISLATWHGYGSTTTISEIRYRCNNAGLSQLLEVFQEGAEAGVARLLTAFYFRQHGHRPDGEPTFEFTHKSFREYLTARRLVRAIQRIHSERERRKDDPDSGWDERGALKHWAELCCPQPMDQYLFRFFRNEVLIQEKVTASHWQKTLFELISFMLEFGMPMEQVIPRPDHLTEMLFSFNAEEALLAALYACALVTEKISEVRWTKEVSMVDKSINAGVWLGRLQGQRYGPMNTMLVLECLGFLSLQGCILHLRDLMDANPNDSDLRNAELTYALLMKARLERANLTDANLTDANLERANLTEANFTGAILDGAKGLANPTDAVDDKRIITYNGSI